MNLDRELFKLFGSAQQNLLMCSQPKHSAVLTYVLSNSCGNTRTCKVPTISTTAILRSGNLLFPHLQTASKFRT